MNQNTLQQSKTQMESQQAKQVSQSAHTASLAITKVKGDQFSCDGGGDLGHPLVYLTFESGEKTHDCPYCSMRFVRET